MTYFSKLLFSKFHFKFLGRRLIFNSTSWTEREPLLKFLILPNLFWNEIRVSKIWLFFGSSIPLFTIEMILLLLRCWCGTPELRSQRWRGKTLCRSKGWVQIRMWRCNHRLLRTCLNFTKHPHFHCAKQILLYGKRWNYKVWFLGHTPKTWGMRKGSDECRDKKSARDRNKGTCSLKENGFL